LVVKATHGDVWVRGCERSKRRRSLIENRQHIEYVAVAYNVWKQLYAELREMHVKV